MIVKVQRELTPNPDGSVLVYDEDKSFYQQLPMTKEIRAQFGKWQLKGHFDAQLIDGVIHLGKRVRDQGW